MDRRGPPANAEDRRVVFNAAHGSRPRPAPWGSHPHRRLARWRRGRGARLHRDRGAEEVAFPRIAETRPNSPCSAAGRPNREKSHTIKITGTLTITIK